MFNCKPYSALAWCRQFFLVRMEWRLALLSIPPRGANVTLDSTDILSILSILRVSLCACRRLPLSRATAHDASPDMSGSLFLFFFFSVQCLSIRPGAHNALLPPRTFWWRRFSFAFITFRTRLSLAGTNGPTYFSARRAKRDASSLRSSTALLLEHCFFITFILVSGACWWKLRIVQPIFEVIFHSGTLTPKTLTLTR